MAIESEFSKVKSFLKANEIAFEAYSDPTNLVLAAFASITQQHCLGSIEHNSYTHMQGYFINDFCSISVVLTKIEFQNSGNVDD